MAFAAVSASAQERSGGAELYRTGCAACHGVDGRGNPQATVGFDLPLPDFTDCSFATVEPDADWLAVTHSGGPARAFDRRMPAFGELLTEAEMLRTLAYARAFCTNPAWPRGELNVPRALVTEKAFPENEAVLTTTIVGGDEGAVGNEFLYEQRLGARSQFEVVVPIDLQKDSSGWQRGLGDVAVAVKHVVFHSLSNGTILSAAGEVVLPTGKESLGLGKGFTVFEPFVAFGQLFPADGFVQVQGGFEIPTDRSHADESFLRTAVGKSFVEGRFGRSWSPIVEFLAVKELAEGESVTWDIVPQMQVTLSTRQHIMVNGGVRIPLNKREGRSTQVLAYFLWDWFDGGLFDGW
jgi:hypothetical protein